MTTDPFTEAARAEAERRWSRDQEDGHPLPGHARMSRRIGFEIGALWAAAQEDDGHDGWCGCGCQEPTDAEKAVRELNRRATEHDKEAGR